MVSGKAGGAPARGIYVRNLVRGKQIFICEPTVATALAAFQGHPQAAPTVQDIDPETGYPILDGAICPF